MSVFETFIKIDGFEKYEVSNLGKVRNIKSAGGYKWRKK